MKMNEELREGAPSVQELRRQKKHWVKKMLELKTEETLYTLSTVSPADHPVLHLAALEWPAEIGGRLRLMSGESAEALFLIMLTALKCTLHKHTGGDSITVACPQRKHTDPDMALPEYQWLPLIDVAPGQRSFREWLYKIKTTYTEAVRNGDYPIKKLVTDMRVIHDRDYTFLNHVRMSLRELHGEVEVEQHTEGLLLHLGWEEGTLRGVLSGSSRFFSAHAVESFASQYAHILGELIISPDHPVEASSWLSFEDRRRWLEEYASGPYLACANNVMDLFEEQVRRTPEAEAVRTPDYAMSYQKLHERVRRWASALVKGGVKPGEVIALYLDRSAETAVAMLAVLKAGACILPIDVQTPNERARFMLNDAQVTRLVTHVRNAENPLFAGIEQVLLCENLDAETENGEALESALGEALLPASGDSSAYMIYTSGTTGKPKGVVVLHQGLANSIAWRRDEYGLSTQDRTIQLFSYSFDGFMTGFFTPLVSGASVFLATDSQVKDPLRLKQLLAVHQITHFICVPALYRLLLEQINQEDNLPLRSITLAGERIASSLIRESRERLPGVEIVNEYGPTEASVVAIFKRNVLESADVPIGRPIANMKAYILDERNEPVPPGITGELHLSGPGLAKGYLNRPELTEEAFISSPFEPGERLYRTGDLARWSEEGEIYCLGRKDAQVKLRGYRIELPEIEQRLLVYPGVQAAAVLCEEEDGVPVRLVAYLQCDDVKASELREYMAGQLPSYMLPARYYRIERLPLSENGKMDKKALLSLEAPLDLDVEFREPENDTERQLCEIFADVLQLKRVSADESFFNVGGHSLKATMLMSRIQKTFGVNIGIDDIFEKQTVRALAAAIAEKGARSYHPVTPAESAPCYPLSSAQKRMYTLFRRDPHSIAYNMAEALIIDGDLDRSRLELALKLLAERHEILRTTFEGADGEPIQVVHPDSKVSLEYTEQPPMDLEETIRSFVRPFDLASRPLYRIGLNRLEARKHLLLIDIHHIVADGASVGIFITELARLYNGDKLPEITIQYKDFSVWQQQRREESAFLEQERYWLEQFNSGVPSLSLPYDYPRPKFKSMEGGRLSFTVDADRTAVLKKLAADHGVTVFMLLLSVYQIMLSKLSGQEELVVGSPVSGRMQAELEQTMGMFVNVVPIRATVSPQLHFAELLAQVKKNALGAFENQAFQYEELASRLDYTRDASRNPLFDVMFVLQNMPENRFDFRGLHFTHVGFEQTVSKFDLTLAGFEGGDGVLYFDLEYCTRLFRKETAAQYTDYFLHILQTVIEHPQMPLSAITLLPVDVLDQQWSEINRLGGEVLPQLTLPAQFAALAKCYPHKEALAFGELRMTYGELDALSDQWARWLQLHGAGFEDVVAVRLERSFEMIAAFLAVLKAGAVYLPIDPAVPTERAQYMLEDSGAVILLNDHSVDGGISFKGHTVLVTELELGEDNADVLEHKPQLHSLAYIIYTSGTTGNPKGVALEHAGLANLPEVYRSKLGVNSDDRILQFAPCSFDASVWEIAMALGTGSTLCLVSNDTIADPEHFEQYAEQMGITVATLPPAYMARLNPSQLQSLHLVITAGSEPSAAVLANWRQHMRCINAYGPTEASVCAAMWEYEEKAWEEEQLSRSVPIGFPILNNRICIVDAALNPLPAGVTGELCIAGIGLARGYLNQPELTRRYFVSTNIPGFERMYRSGDLAQLLPDGRILYQGRIDSQLKIRGHRLEPGEVKARMLQIEGVQNAAVLPKRQQEGEVILAAYYTGESAPQPRELKIQLSAGLPHYMIPTLLLKLDALPLTSHGKVDAAALQRLEPSRELGTALRTPGNKVEALIVKVFEEVLEVQGIGAEDTFNELGGDSISAMKASFFLKEKGLALEVRDLLVHQSAASLGDLLLERSGREDAAGNAIHPEQEVAYGERESEVGIEIDVQVDAEIGIEGNGREDTSSLKDLLHQLAVQQRTYTSQLSAGQKLSKIPLTGVQAMYLGRSENVGVVIPFPASKRREDIETLVLRLVQQQEMLRCFHSGGEIGHWNLHDLPSRLSLPYIKVVGDAVEAQIKQLIQELYYGRFDFDIPGSLLYRLVLIENGVSGAKQLVYASHHSLSDGLSCSLIAEALTFPAAVMSGKNSDTGYLDYMRVVEEGPKEISFTELEHLFDLMTYRQLLNDLERQVELFPKKGATSITMEWPLTGNHPEEGWTILSSLLAAFGRDFLQMEHLPVQLVHSGRRFGRETFYHLVGNFTDYIPLVLHAGNPAENLIHRVREVTQAASDHHIRFTALEGNEVSKGVMLNYFGAVQEGEAEASGWAPDGGPSFAEAAADYGICWYVSHVGSTLRIDIALPFETDPEALQKRIAGGSVRGLQS